MKKLSRPSELRNDEEIVLSVRQWVNTFVMEMNLCPFAKYEMLNNRVRFATTRAITEEQLLMSLQDELELLNSDPSVETTLLIHPNVLQDFYDYNQFLSNADNLLLEMGLEGTYQSRQFSSRLPIWWNKSGRCRELYKPLSLPLVASYSGGES